MAGTIGIQNTITALFTQSSAGAAANNYTMTRAATMVDATVIARATQMGGTLTVGNGASAITDAIVCATDTNVTRAGTIDDAQYALAVGDSLRFTTAGAATLCAVAVTLVAPVADSTTIA